MLKPAERPHFSQRLELLRIQSSAGVVPSSVTVGEDAEGLSRISFDLETELVAGPPTVDIHAVERIHFVYGPGRKIGETAPTWVNCDREDFPRDIGHLCAGPPGCPATPCLALAGLQPLYERGGIEVVMERLRQFMRDAKTGSLMADGWEPVPFGIEQGFTGGELEPYRFQELAAASPAGGYAVGATLHIHRSKGEYVMIHPTPVPMGDLRSVLGEHNGAGRTEGFQAIPWVFVWPPKERVEQAPLFEAWTTQSELRGGLERIGLADDYDKALGQLMTGDLNFKVNMTPLSGKRLVVVVGVWRPTPIIEDFFGYSADPEARTLELRAFLVSAELADEICADSARVSSIIGSYPPRPELLQWVSGVGKIAPLALLGAGALGSAIFENLIRSGARDSFVQDQDGLGSHNLARHSARLADVHDAKTEQSAALTSAIVQPGSTTINTSREDIAATPLETLKANCSGRLVIDATADERVRVKMDELRADFDRPIIRTEMFHLGRLGTTFISLPGGPTLSELMTSLIAAAVDNPDVAAWLDQEAAEPLGPAPLLYGFGCTSQTVHLASHVVEQQAAVATTAIVESPETSGILVNPLDEKHRPLGCRWLPIPPYTHLRPPTHDDWAIAVSGAALESMKAGRSAALPNETGGYLYGCCDPVRQQLIVSLASPLPPGSTATPTTLELGPAGETRLERRLKRKTHGWLYLVGTWHSHAGTSARMSGRDQRTLAKHSAKDAPLLRPTLMIIVAGDDVQAHLEVP
ncbi:MAG TPA: ThiF family adenylyltransferase [Sphingomicrobium sp.]|nr:ThiF family adenylyltransferase [Sphingomicrobium sp.]